VTDFAALLRALTQNNVTFVIVGAFAAAAHGSAHVTKDLGICYERTAQNFERLAAALGPFHPTLRDVPPGISFRWDSATIRQGMNFTLVTDVGEIDLFGELAGARTYLEASRGSVLTQLYGHSFQIASLEVLITSKRAAGRPKDLAVLPELEALRDLKLPAKEPEAGQS
jgi:hypothetical protein